MNLWPTPVAVDRTQIRVICALSFTSPIPTPAAPSRRSARNDGAAAPEVRSPSVMATAPTSQTVRSPPAQAPGPGRHALPAPLPPPVCLGLPRSSASPLRDVEGHQERSPSADLADQDGLDAHRLSRADQVALRRRGRPLLPM